MRAWILERYQVYARVLLLTALFLSPVIFYRGTADVFNLVKITALWVLGIAALALWLAWSLERGVWPPMFRIGVATLGFLGAGAVASIFSQNPVLSVLGLYHRYGGLIPFALYAAIMFLIVALYWERPGDLREIARVAAAAAIVMSVYVLIQAAGQDWIRWTGPEGRPPRFPVGTMGNSNFAGGYLGISAPFVLYVALAARREATRTIMLLALGMVLLALWFTQTRGGMIAGGAGLTAVVFMYRDRLPRWMKVTTAAGVAVAGLLAVMVLWHPGFDRPPGPLERMQTFRTGTFVIRTWYWGAAWRIFKDHPVIGTGLDTYYAHYPSYRDPDDGATLGLEITDKPHNIYLEYASNSGLAGLGTYLLVVGLGLWYGYRKSNRLEGEARLLTVTFVGVLTGYLGQGLFSIDVPPLAVMGWVALGGIAAIADPAVVEARSRLRAMLGQAAGGKRGPGGNRKGRGKARNARRSPDPQTGGYPLGRPAGGPLRLVLHLLTVAVSIFLLALGVMPVAADAFAKSGEVGRGETPPDEVDSQFQRAIALHPLEPAYRAMAGRTFEERAEKETDPAGAEAHFEAALGYYREALGLQPGNIFYLINIARLQTTWAERLDPGRFRQAEEWWARVVAHDRTNWALHNQYALMLNSWANAAGGDPEIRLRAATRLEEALRLKPDYVAGWINLAKIHQALGESDEARRAVLEALELEPSNPEATSLLAALDSEDPGG